MCVCVRERGGQGERERELRKVGETGRDTKTKLAMKLQNTETHTFAMMISGKKQRLHQWVWERKAKQQQEQIRQSLMQGHFLCLSVAESFLSAGGGKETGV